MGVAGSRGVELKDEVEQEAASPDTFVDRMAGSPLWLCSLLLLPIFLIGAIFGDLVSYATAEDAQVRIAVVRSASLSRGCMDHVQPFPKLLQELIDEEVGTEHYFVRRPPRSSTRHATRPELLSADAECTCGLRSTISLGRAPRCCGPSPRAPKWFRTGTRPPSIVSQSEKGGTWSSSCWASTTR